MLAAKEAGTKLFGVVGWDPTGEWSERRLNQLGGNFYAFLPNAPEAMAFTGKADPPWAALYSLADRVPVAVVTLGPPKRGGSGFGNG